jgi:hypothetical protein
VYAVRALLRDNRAMGIDRPRPRFSLKTLLVVVTLLCIAMPILIRVLRWWDFTATLVLAIVAVPVLIEIAGVLIASLLDRWTERERETEERKHWNQEDST